MTKSSVVVLVHGAWANGSSWSKVIPRLEKEGLRAIAVHLPLTSLADDTATVKRALALEEAPVLLVGHSYGGAVITEAGTDPKVEGLVYVAGFAPDAGESAGSLGAGVPPTPMATEFLPDAAGFIKLTKKGVFECFAQDLTDAEKALLFAAQAPTAGQALGGTVSKPAWRGKPTWYVVANHDRAIQPDLERRLAERMGATTISVDSSHVAMLARPDEVSTLIIKAAAGTR